MSAIPQGSKVHVVTTNGGEADYVTAWTWGGPSYCLCVLSGYPPGYAETIWIDPDRLRSVTVVEEAS